MVAIPPDSGGTGLPVPSHSDDSEHVDVALGPAGDPARLGGMAARIDAMMAGFEDDGGDDDDEVVLGNAGGGEDAVTMVRDEDAAPRPIELAGEVPEPIDDDAMDGQVTAVAPDRSSAGHNGTSNGYGVTAEPAVSFVEPSVDDAVPVEVVSGDRPAIDAAPVAVAAVEVAAVEDAAVDDAPVEVAAVEDAPVDDAPVEVAAVDDAPVEVAAVDDAPVEAAPEVRDGPEPSEGVEELSLDDLEAESAPLSTAAPVRPAIPPRPPAPPAIPRPPIPLPPLAKPAGRPPTVLPPRVGVAVIPPRAPTVVPPPPIAPPLVVPPRPSTAVDVPAGRDDDEATGVAPPRPTPPAPPPAPAVEAEVADAAELAEVDVAADDAPSAPPMVATIVPDVPLEQRLESPTAVERAVGELGEVAWEARAADLQRALDRAGDRERVADLAYELGELCERRLADEARAVKAYGRALASDPSLRANLWAIRRVFYRRGLWPNLIKLIDAEVRFARDDREKADLLAEKAAVLADKLGQTDDARTALEEAVHLDPTALPPLYALERIAAAEGDHARLVELWAQLAAASTRPERKLCYLLDQIRFWIDQGGDLDRARDLVAEAAALGVDPERVAAERLRVAELAGDSEEILAALEAQATMLLGRGGPAGTPDDAIAPSEPGVAPSRGAALRLKVVALRRRQAQVARAAGDSERAWDYLQAAIALAPGRPLLLADLADVAEDLGRYDELAELVQSWQAIEGDPRRALTLSLRRADALLRGGRRDAALTLLASLEATAPGLAPIAALRERDALGALDFAALGEAWSRVGDALLVGADVGAGAPIIDPAAAGDAYVAAALIWKDEVGGERGEAAARAALERALAIGERSDAGTGGEPTGAAGAAGGKAPRGINAKDAVALEVLIDLHERAGRVDDAAAAIEAALTSDAGATPAAAHRLLARLGRLYRSHGRLEDALAVDQRRFASEPEDLTTGWRIDAALEELGKDEQRLAHLAVLAERETEGARKGYALVTAARLADALGHGDRAIDLYRATLAVWPDDDFARAALRAALRRLGRWAELADALVAEAGGLGDGPDVARALREAAWVVEDRLGEPARAHAIYRQLLDRVAEDPHARAGVARTAAAAGEGVAGLAALEAIADDATGALAAPALVALAEAHEATTTSAAGSDEALEAYQRALVVAEPGAVAGAVAALATIDLAVRRGDSAARVAASRALADRTSDPGLAAALHEDVGWLHALVLEDFDEAAAAFAAALAIAPASPGALLGAALVAARRQDAAGLSHAYEQLAAATAQPEAAAALHLRAAAMATAAGDHDAALVRVAAARAIAPDDVGALLVAAEHSAGAAPLAAGEDAAGAIDRLLGRAEILAMRSALADDPTARDGWELDRAEALEAAGRLREAGAVITGVLRASPNDLRALEALRRLARRGGDDATRARAAVALAQRTADLDAKRELYAEAAAVFDPPAGADRPRDAAAAVAIYRRMLADEPGLPVFERLRELLRDAGDVRGLVLALGDRLTWVDGGGGTVEDGVPLLFERAQIRRALGDLRGASGDLDELLKREPGHAAALRLRAQAALDLGDAPGAVELWRRYLAAESTTGDGATRRAEAELILARVLAEDLNDVAGAIEQVERVIAQTPGDANLRERLVGLATRGQDWMRVARELRELVRLRPSPGERARDELRLGQLLRDRLSDRAGARAAFERGRELDPLNLDLLRELAELTAVDRPSARAEILARGIDDLRNALAGRGDAGAVAIYDRLAQAFGWLGDRDGQWLALVALEAMSTPSPEQRAILAGGRERPLPPPSRHILDPNARAALRAPGAAGVLTDLWRSASAAVTQALGVDAGKLGFVRGDKLAAKALGQGALRKYDALAAALASLGVDDAELYVSEARTGFARVLSGDDPVICVGGDVAAGATPLARFQLGRAVWLAADRTGTLVDLKDAEVGWYLVAALRAAELPVPPALAELVAGEEAQVTERIRVVGKHLARRDKKAIQALGPRLAEIRDVAGWRRAMMASSQRAGLLFAGDVSVALGAMDVGRGGRHVATDPGALDLAAWSVSAAHLELRRQRQLALGGPGGSR